MKPASQRVIWRWLHIICSIPIIGFIYGPVSEVPEAVAVVRYILVPAVVLSGIWMWKGHVIKRLLLHNGKNLSPNNPK